MVPSVPTGLVILTPPAPFLPGQVNLVWNVNPDADNVIFFFIYVDNLRPTNAGVGANPSGVSPVLPNGTHTVQISAVNATGESALTAPATFVISNSPLSSTQSMLVALTDALALKLNQGVAANAFCLTFSAVRRFLPIVDLKTVADGAPPLVILVPSGDEEERGGGVASPSFTAGHDVAILIYARVGGGDDAETRCEPLMLLRDQIRNYLKPPGVVVVGPRTTKSIMASVDGQPAYGERALVELECFVSQQVFSFVTPV